MPKEEHAIWLSTGKGSVLKTRISVALFVFKQVIFRNIFVCLCVYVHMYTYMHAVMISERGHELEGEQRWANVWSCHACEAVAQAVAPSGLVEFMDIMVVDMYVCVCDMCGVCT